MILTEKSSSLATRFIFTCISLAAAAAQAHSGGTNSSGCHAGTKPYHCHAKPDDGVTDDVIQIREDISTSLSGMVPSIKVRPEADYNQKFCQSVGGQTETRHYYTYAGGRSHINVDC